MMKLLETQDDEMRSTDENKTESDSDANLRRQLQVAVERATLQLESRVLRSDDSDTVEADEEFDLVNDLPN
jgi:hypothetical protein